MSELVDQEQNEVIGCFTKGQKDLLPRLHCRKAL